MKPRLLAPFENKKSSPEPEFFMIKFREHRGALGESMKTVVELKNREELNAYIADLLRPYCVINPSEIIYKKYGYDRRIDWHTLLVSVKDYGVVGFASEFPEEAEAVAHALG